MKKLEEQRDRELAELERLKLEAAQPAVDAATLFNSVSFTHCIVTYYYYLIYFEHSTEFRENK